jgi:nicotinamidase-related amidase
MMHGTHHPRGLFVPARLRDVGPALIVLFLVLSTTIVQALAESPRKIDATTALLIIDVQEFYFPGGAIPLEEPEEASRNAGKLLEKFRAENRMVVHVGHNVSKEAAFHADVMPKDGEKIFIKDEVSAFNGTDLLDYLRENEIERLVICGMQTHMCVEAAVRAAHDFGFECILVGDACATRALSFKGRSIDATDVHYSTLGTLDRTYATVVDTDTFLKEY